MNQAELTDGIYLRRSPLSAMENGKMMLDAETSVYLAGVLDKPIRYSFPDVLLPRVEGGLRNWEREYLESIRATPASNRQRIAEYAEPLAIAAEYEQENIRRKIRKEFEGLGLPDEISHRSLFVRIGGATHSTRDLRVREELGLPAHIVQL